MASKRPSNVVLAVLLAAAAAAAGGERAARYVAVFADGRRLEGNVLSGWEANPASPQLDGTPLLSPGRPMRWLLNRTLPPGDAADDALGYVEFVGGDRLAGRVVAADPGAPSGGAEGLTLLDVRPGGLPGLPTQMERPVVRVLAAEVSHIVRGRQPRRHCQPGTAFLSDGTLLRYRRLRWLPDAVSLLLDESVRRVPLNELAELHLPAADAWQAHCRRLAALSPSLRSPMVRLETATGLVVTSSTSCFRAALVGDPNTPANWYHLVQPAWSVDSIWVPFRIIRMRQRFAPQELPLTWLEPAQATQRSSTGFSWPWRRDRNVEAGRLIAGGRPAGWGLGVHAHSELTFELPPPAVSLRTRVGLDLLAGRRGCARALVRLDATKARCLFRSKLLIGSAEAVDTGELKLPSPGGERRLTLVAGAAHDDRPAGADPLDIRDTLDWVEPLIRLDPTLLRKEVFRHVCAAMPVWEGWEADAAGPVPVGLAWNGPDATQGRFVHAVATAGKPLVLTRRQQGIGPNDRWLKLHVRQLGETAATGSLEVRVDGRSVARMPVHRAGLDRPYLVDLSAFRGPRASLQVAYVPGSPDERIDWPALSVTDRKTRVNWVPLHVLEARSQNGAVLTVQPDGSILAAPGQRKVAREADTYVVRAATDLPRITAVRLEALADSSLPGGGPGYGDGSFILSQFRISTPPLHRRPMRGRYVRIELPREKQFLSLAEVQVFRAPPDEKALLAALRLPKPPRGLAATSFRPGEIVSILETPPMKRSLPQRLRLRAYLDAICENVAPKGRAQQSSTMGQFAAGVAIDGAVGGGFTHTEQQDRPWWLLDLGSEQPIDRVVIWNRIDFNLSNRLKDFDVVVLDANRNVVWRRQAIADPPVPALELSDCDARDLAVASASESFAARDYTARRSLDSTAIGWAVTPRFGESHAAVFVLAAPVDARRTGLQFKLTNALEQWPRTLGRFRILVTGDEPPESAEPVGIVIGPSAAPLPGGRASPLASPHALFEDDGRFVAAKAADAAKFALVADDKHAGRRAARFAPGGPYVLRLDRTVPIRAQPVEGEFRHIRFAFRKYGGGRISLALEHVSSGERPCRYEAGADAPTDANARCVWGAELPAEWIVMDRDVFRDFGSLDLTGLAVTCTGGGFAVLDHVYVARAVEDFNRLPPAPTPEQANRKARTALADPVLRKALPAVVSLTAAGRHGMGVLIGADGCVLTAGHLLVDAGGNVTVRTRDGRTAHGKAAGINRDLDVGLVRIVDKGRWQGIEIGEAKAWKDGHLFVGASLSPSSGKGEAPVTYVTAIDSVGERTVRAKYALADAIAGGPLLGLDGRLVGVHVGHYGQGNLVFTKAGRLREQWGRLRQPGAWGRWLPGTGPMLGIYSTQRGQDCWIDYVYPGTPAAAAGIRAKDVIARVEGTPVANLYDVGAVLADKDPGATVTATIRRGDKTIELKVGLMHRRRLPPPPN